MEQLPKEFIKDIFLGQYENIIIKCGHAYLGYALIAIGIEFLGKCMDTKLPSWHPESSQHFDLALKEIPSLKKYSGLNLRDLLRNGMAHSLAPKPGIDLSERKHGTTHLGLDSIGLPTLNVEDFYEDFKEACKHVINQVFLPSDKMNRGFIKH